LKTSIKSAKPRPRRPSTSRDSPPRHPKERGIIELRSSRAGRSPDRPRGSAHRRRLPAGVSRARGACVKTRSRTKALVLRASDRGLAPLKLALGTCHEGLDVCFLLDELACPLGQLHLALLDLLGAELEIGLEHRLTPVDLSLAVV